MKKKFIFIVSMILALTMAFSLVACKDDDDKTSGGGETLPTQQQWEQVGIDGSFTAAVTGTLAKSQVNDDGEISMKWTGSNEQSLDNTITWLNGEGYNCYGGQSAEKINDGFTKTYMAEKILGGASAMSASTNGASVVVPMSYAYTTTAFASQESKTMMAESYYITADFSASGVNFKAGELYLDIYEKEEYTPPTGLVTTWPAKDVLTVLGTSIPVYTGTSTGYQVSDLSMGYLKNVQILVYGASESDATAYNATLSQNGFTVNEHSLYEKRLGSGDYIEISAYMTQSADPSSYQLVNVLMINAMLEKNSGAYTSWSGLNLSDFNSANIPAYSGGTSFDLDYTSTDDMISIEEYEAMITQLAPYESMLDAKTKAELEEAREMVELASQVRVRVVTVYGTNSNEVEAYETALSSAGFIDGLKNTTDYQYQVEVSDEGGKALIVITKMPIELAEEIIDEEETGDESDSSSSVTETLDFSDLPTNVKFTLVDGNNNQYNLSKIGNDYLIKTSGVISCLKFNGTAWVEYVYYDGTWMENTDETYTNLEDNSSMSVFSNILFANDVSDFLKGEDEQVAGQTCAVYTLNDDSAASMGVTSTSIKKLNEDGLVFYYSEIYYMNGALYMSTTYQLTLWDTSVTAFEVALPQ